MTENSDDELIYQFLNQSQIDIDLTDNEYQEMIAHFRNNDTNQFALLIINKVLTKKGMTEKRENSIPFLMAIIADKLSEANYAVLTDEQIKSLAKMLYKLILIIDIDEIYRSRF